MKIVVTGSSGLIGSHLCDYLSSEGHQVSKLLRKKPSSNSSDPFWSPSEGLLDPMVLADRSAIVHLGGASIAGGRLTAARKKLLWTSRIEGTKLLVKALESLAPEQRPQVLVSASAIGYYTYDTRPLDEKGAEGKGFLSKLCAAWETEARRAEKAGIRVVCLRIGVVLSTKGGAYATLLRIQRLGLGAVLGNGTQYVSWIHINDLIRMIDASLSSSEWSGIYNATAPHPLQHRSFIHTLARVHGHKLWLPPIPASLLRILMGEASDLLLESQHTLPARALRLGFHFQFNELEAAITDLHKKAK